MIEFINEFIEYMISKYKRDNFGVEEIQRELMIKFNKKSLMYHAVAKSWLKEFFSLINSLNYGKYNLSEQRLYLNFHNEQIEIWLIKYKARYENEIINPIEEVKIFDELIK